MDGGPQTYFLRNDTKLPDYLMFQRIQYIPGEGARTVTK